MTRAHCTPNPTKTRPANRFVLSLPAEVLWHIWSYMKVQEVLRFSCCSRACSDAVSGFLAHAGNVLIVHRQLKDNWLLSLVCKLSRINLLSIVCGSRQVGSMGYEFSQSPALTFSGIEKMLSLLPPHTLVDINGGNCYLGNINNLTCMFARQPNLLVHLANLHLVPGLPKEVVLPLLHYCCNLRALSLDQCIVGGSGHDVVMEFPYLQYLTLRGVSFAYSMSLYGLLSSCGNSLLAFEMTACIAFRDEELDALVRQRNLQVFTLKQRCRLSNAFIQQVSWNSLKIMCLDSVLPYSGIGYIISNSERLQVLEVNDIVCDELFHCLKIRNTVNPNLQRLILKNNASLGYSLSNEGLGWALQAFPNTDVLSLHQVGTSQMPVMQNLRKLFLVEVAIDLQLIEKITHAGIFLEKLYCKSLKCMPGMTTQLNIDSTSLNTVSFKNCLIERLCFANAPNLTRLIISRLQNASLMCCMRGICSLRVLELSKLHPGAIESFLYSIVRDAHLLSKWLKVKCLQCCPSSHTLEEVCSKFCGNVLFVSRPAIGKLNWSVKCILNNLRYLMNSTRTPATHTTDTQMWPTPTHYSYSLPNNIHLMGNFPIEPLTCHSPLNINSKCSVRDRSLTIFTELGRDY
eukprot:Phypoly_transcript_04098.p1 GENE.Phypoly_transcript_04098~~Phypoly_transcript_04098.p1  ORF type:complete len:629 (+),score=5.49 Phypoly_transcript_04098:241-2127(+)